MPFVFSGLGPMYNGCISHVLHILHPYISQHDPNTSKCNSRVFTNSDVETFALQSPRVEWNIDRWGGL